jgi:uncharacterized membrane protein
VKDSWLHIKLELIFLICTYKYALLYYPIIFIYQSVAKKVGAATQVVGPKAHGISVWNKKNQNVEYNLETKY